MIKTITPQELTKRKQEDDSLQLVDVRTPVEFREVHVEFARNLPLDRLNPADFNGQSAERGPVYVICRSGSRGKMACEKLIKAGLEDVINVAGGTEACVQAGLPVVRGKKAISLERQVRIAAGFLVTLGVALGFWHPAFLGISAFVGLGLMFAGITDTCAMGMLLSKMPWNQVKSDGCCSNSSNAEPGPAS